MARQRRANGEGGVTRRKDGSWMARYTVQTPTRPKRKVIYAKSHEEARKKLAEAIANRDKGLTYDSEGLTVEEYLGRWLEDSVRGSVKATTFQSYGSLVRLHVCPTVGSTKLAALTPRTCRPSTARSSTRASPPRRSSTYTPRCTAPSSRP